MKTLSQVSHFTGEEPEELREEGFPRSQSHSEMGLNPSGANLLLKNQRSVRALAMFWVGSWKCVQKDLWQTNLVLWPGAVAEVTRLIMLVLAGPPAKGRRPLLEVQGIGPTVRKLVQNGLPWINMTLSSRETQDHWAASLDLPGEPRTQTPISPFYSLNPQEEGMEGLVGLKEGRRMGKWFLKC